MGVNFPVLSLLTWLPLLGAAFILTTRGDDAVVAATLDQLQTQALDLAIQHDQLGARVSLYLALGGGFEAPPATPDDTAPATKAITKP